MILESAQLLSTAHRVLDGKLIKKDFAYADGTLRKKNWYKLDDDLDNILYSATHVNHPSAKWVRESLHHYSWLYRHFRELLAEYTYRYNKTHKCHFLLPYLEFPPKNISNKTFTQPPACMDPKYVIGQCSVDNYRNYYKLGKNHLHHWTRRSPPTWIFSQTNISI